MVIPLFLAQMGGYIWTYGLSRTISLLKQSEYIYYASHPREIPTGIVPDGLDIFRRMPPFPDVMMFSYVAGSYAAYHLARWIVGYSRLLSSLAPHSQDDSSLGALRPRVGRMPAFFLDPRVWAVSWAILMGSEALMSHYQLWVFRGEGAKEVVVQLIWMLDDMWINLVTVSAAYCALAASLWSKILVSFLLEDTSSWRAQEAVETYLIKLNDELAKAWTSLSVGWLIPWGTYSSLYATLVEVLGLEARGITESLLGFARLGRILLPLSALVWGMLRRSGRVWCDTLRVIMRSAEENQRSQPQREAIFKTVHRVVGRLLVRYSPIEFLYAWLTIPEIVEVFLEILARSVGSSVYFRLAEAPIGLLTGFSIGDAVFSRFSRTIEVYPEVFGHGSHSVRSKPGQISR